MNREDTVARTWLTGPGSREDSNTIKSQISRWTEASLATVWQSLVRRMYDFDHWQFTESWNPYAPPDSGLELYNLTSYISDRFVGFVAFDQYKSMLQDADGKISGPRTVIAGFGAGATESLLAVTPFESIKTTLYAVSIIVIAQGSQFNSIQNR